MEQKPPLCFNAKPVRRSAARELLDWGKTFPGGAKDTVKLLGFSVEYGLERVLAVKAALPNGITPPTIPPLVQKELEPPPAPIKLDTAYDFPITSLDLSRYDDKYGVVAQ